MNENYFDRINEILIYIDKNLDSQLSLEKISNIGYYSPFHLHRLFKAVTGETLNTYITRKRIEKVAWLLMNRKELTVTELSMRYGFNSNSSLTKTFTKFYGISPSKFRNLVPNEYSKIGKINSKNGQKKHFFEEYICNINNYLNFIKMNAKVEIKEMLKLDLAFVTHIGTKNMENHFDKLLKWARPKGLLENKNFKLVRIYHDSFKITEPEKIRMSACISIDKPIEVNGEIGLTSIEKGKFIVGSFEIEPKDFGKSWDGLIVWMNEHGYKKADRDPFEIIYNNFTTHPEHKCIVDLCIPIE